MYRGLTIEQAIYKYAPPNENDTEDIIKFLIRYTTVPRKITRKDIINEVIGF
jgi:hypothetical protein